MSGITVGDAGGPNEWLVSPPSLFALCPTVFFWVSWSDAVLAQVGDVFLKNVYLSTNYDNDEISLAKPV